MLTEEQKIKIQQKDATTPDALKRDATVDYTEGWFFVTLNTRDEVPVLSTCEGSPSIPDGQPLAPHCRYTKLGQKIVDVWNTIPDFHPGVTIDLFEAMPEHVHGLLYLKPGNKEHLGKIIGGFMGGCSHAYWDTLGIDWRKDHPTKGLKMAPKSAAAHVYARPSTGGHAPLPTDRDRDHTRSYRGPALFVRGYNDMEPITPAEVDIKRAYIRDQARKRLIQGDHHSCFVKHLYQYTHTWNIGRIMQAISNDPFFHSNADKCQQAQRDIMARLCIAPATHPRAGLPTLCYLGNKALLAPRSLPDGTTSRLLPLICHRRDAWQFEKQKAAVLSAARKGAVIVSAFISPKEREIREQLMTELLPVIEITDNGFSDRYKPVGKAFYAMAENRLVQISPWSYVYDKDTQVTRDMCLVMNDLARVISGTHDDWWKGE